MSTDPAEVAAAMSAGERNAADTAAAGLAAARSGPPAPEPQRPAYPPVLVHEVGPAPGAPAGEPLEAP